MSEYTLRFIELCHHAPDLLSTIRERECRFIEGLTYSLRFGMAQELETETPFIRLWILLGGWNVSAGWRGRIGRLRSLVDLEDLLLSILRPRPAIVEVLPVDQFCPHFRSHMMLQLAMDFRELVPGSHPLVHLLYEVFKVITSVIPGRLRSSNHIGKEVVLSVGIQGTW